MGASESVLAKSSKNQNTSVCPVDHKTREAWLKNASSSSMTPEDSPSHAFIKHRPLSHDREISSIPRATTRASDTCPTLSSPYLPSSPTASHSSLYNDGNGTEHDPITGNWIYPSERQFFDALVRKNTPNSTTSASDLATSVASIIPIHNAVNERAWWEILSWESRAPFSDPGSRSCGGPKLYSFRGLGTENQFLSPRARFNSWLGFQLPFDRHDWTIERCGGRRIEYVIDFYQGRSDRNALNSGPKDAKLSFYLDVRPKINTWEGFRMRLMSVFGF